MRKFSLLFTFLLTLTLLSSCGDELGKVAGKVTFKGLPCQPGQTDYKVPPCSGDYPKYDIAIFKSEDEETPVLSTMTNDKGMFEVTLPVGDYIIYTQDGPMPKMKKAHNFSIEKDQTTTLKLSVNTGIL